ncbi:MAG: biotin--[acetyl-CoA-carboxylase] ligase [Chloroflexi bacterium]|nr:biotin--[acetyl-CoA-carboxylase] ligase [Chloroflexota bacterium]
MAAGGRRRLDRRPGAAGSPAGSLLIVHRYQSLPSTQTVARQLAQDGAPEWTVVVAEEQTGGRGRLGSTFHSPRGGLYCSVVLRPPIRPACAGLIGLAAGLASAEAVHDVTGLTPVLKWPNDLLLADRKLSGLLVELEADAERIEYVILGTGVNVNLAAFPTELAGIATSLQLATNRAWSVEALLAALLARLEARYPQAHSSPAILRKAWRTWPNLLGQPVTIADPTGHWSATAEDLADDGALVVRTSSGDVRRVIAADVHLLRA